MEVGEVKERQLVGRGEREQDSKDRRKKTTGGREEKKRRQGEEVRRKLWK